MSTTLAGAAITGAIAFVTKTLPSLLRQSKNKSLVHFTKATRVEPIAIVDQSLTNLDYMTDVMQTVNSIFTSYWLQAAAVAVNVGRVNTLKLLDALNPQRDVKEAAATMLDGYGVESRLPNTLVVESDLPSQRSLEAFQYGLPSLENDMRTKALGQVKQYADSTLNPTFSKVEKVDHEELAYGRDGAPIIDPATGKQTTRVGSRLETKQENSLNGVRFGNKASLQETVNEAVNLSVGRLVEVTIEDQGKTATFPIQIRVIASLISSPLMAHILGNTGRNVGVAQRYHAWRAGQLELVKDLILCQDIIKAHRKTLMLDKTGTYQEILNRQRGNSAATMMSKTPSIASVSNIVVISRKTATMIEASIGARLSDAKARERLMDNTYIMLLVVVDPDTEMVTIYHSGITLPTKTSVRELKVSNKGKGPDLTEILKAYQLGQNPTL